VSAADQSASAALTIVESNVSNAANIERKFGLALTDLLERFGMPDADILDRHYKANPRADGKKHWAQVVSHYRTDVIHHGYLYQSREKPVTTSEEQGDYTTIRFPLM
jgi:hypothetical protein